MPIPPAWHEKQGRRPKPACHQPVFPSRAKPAPIGCLLSTSPWSSIAGPAETGVMQEYLSNYGVARDARQTPTASLSPTCISGGLPAPFGCLLYTSPWSSIAEWNPKLGPDHWLPREEALPVRSRWRVRDVSARIRWAGATCRQALTAGLGSDCRGRGSTPAAAALEVSQRSCTLLAAKRTWQGPEGPRRGGAQSEARPWAPVDSCSAAAQRAPRGGGVAPSAACSRLQALWRSLRSVAAAPAAPVSRHEGL